MSAWNLGASWEQSPGGLSRPWGPGAGLAAGRQAWGRKARRAGPGAAPALWKAGKGCPVSDGGSRVRWGYRAGTGTGLACCLCTSLHLFAMGCFPTVLSGPHPARGLAAVSGRLFPVLGLWRAFRIFICIRSPHFIPSAPYSVCLPVPAGETAALAGPRLCVYHGFRAASLTA